VLIFCETLPCRILRLRQVERHHCRHQTRHGHFVSRSRAPSAWAEYAASARAPGGNEILSRRYRRIRDRTQIPGRKNSHEFQATKIQLPILASAAGTLSHRTRRTPAQKALVFFRRCHHLRVFRRQGTLWPTTLSNWVISSHEMWLRKN